MIRLVPQQPMTFDDLECGHRFSAGPRTITRADIDAFSSLSGDRTALHHDDAYASSTPFGGVVAHGALVVSVATGLAFDAGIFEGTVLALRSIQVDFDRPVYPGDSVRLQLEVRAKDARPRRDRGRVTFRLELRNQHDKPTLSGDWVLVIKRRGTA